MSECFKLPVVVDQNFKVIYWSHLQTLFVMMISMSPTLPVYLDVMHGLNISFLIMEFL